MSMANSHTHNIHAPPGIPHSPPIDTTAPIDANNVAEKTILITGGASGFGAGFALSWAEHGAHVIVADINDRAGEALVASLRQQTGSEHHHYLHCDVTDWASQLKMFQAAAGLGPHGGIDAVVANAGIRDGLSGRFDEPTGDYSREGDDDNMPKAPDFRCLDVNVRGVMYTAHLALFWLPRNPKSTEPQANNEKRDRHLLLIGSVASILAFPVSPEYTTSKHAVMGLFRSLRKTAWRHGGVRVNMLCPYFISTPFVPPIGRVMLAGSGMGSVEQVVLAATRLMADEGIIGRALVVGPRVRVSDKDGDEEGWEVLDVLGDKDQDEQNGDHLQEAEERGVVMSAWECYAEDFEKNELFTWRFLQLLTQVERIRGWFGWARDILGAVSMMFRGRKR